MLDRESFAPSPRPEPPISVRFVSEIRAGKQLLAGARRAADGRFRLFFAANPRLFRWLFRPALPPAQDDQP